MPNVPTSAGTNASPMDCCWGYSLRNNRYFEDEDSSTDDDDDNGSSAQKLVSNQTEMLNDLDLSTREDTAVYRPNPFTIARINAASRADKNPKDRTGTEGNGATKRTGFKPSEKTNPSVQHSRKGRSSHLSQRNGRRSKIIQGQIVDGLKKQACHQSGTDLEQRTTTPFNPLVSTQNLCVNPGSHEKPSVHPTGAHILTEQTQDYCTGPPPNALDHELQYSLLYQPQSLPHADGLIRDPVLRSNTSPRITNGPILPNVTGPEVEMDRPIAQTADPGVPSFESFTPVEGSGGHTSRFLAPITHETTKPQRNRSIASQHKYIPDKSRPFMDHCSSPTTPSRPIQITRGGVCSSPLLPSLANRRDFIASPSSLPNKPAAYTSSYIAREPSSASKARVQPNHLAHHQGFAQSLLQNALSSHRDTSMLSRSHVETELPPSSPLQPSSPLSVPRTHIYAENEPSQVKRPSPLPSVVLQRSVTAKRKLSPSPSPSPSPSLPSQADTRPPNLNVRQSSPRRRDPYAFLQDLDQPDPDSSWSTLPARGREKIRTPAPKFKTSGAFRLPSKFRPVPIGVDHQVKKTGMSADSTRRIVTFLPTPLISVAQSTPDTKDSKEYRSTDNDHSTAGSELSRFAYPSPSRSVSLVHNLPHDRNTYQDAPVGTSKANNISGDTIQYPPSPPLSDPPLGPITNEASQNDIEISFDVEATGRRYPNIRNLTSR